MARRTFLLSEVTLSEESVNLAVSGDLTVAGTSGFTGVASFGNGTVSAPSITFSSDPDLGFYRSGANALIATAGGVGSLLVDSTQIAVSSNQTIAWTSAVNLGGSADTVLARDAANTLALKNAASAQTIRIYGDATAATLKYMTLTHDGTNGLITTSGGTFGFGTHTTSAGTNINGVTGYISIVDSGGTPRRIAVLT